MDANGKSASRTIRKLGTLNELLPERGPTRDDVMNWAKKQAQGEIADVLYYLENPEYVKKL